MSSFSLLSRSCVHTKHAGTDVSPSRKHTLAHTLALLLTLTHSHALSHALTCSHCALLSLKLSRMVNVFLRYRNIEENWKWCLPMKDAKIHLPALMITAGVQLKEYRTFSHKFTSSYSNARSHTHTHAHFYHTTHTQRKSVVVEYVWGLNWHTL